MDWGNGRYEDAAPSLLPAAKVLVDRAAPRHGEYLLDLGCGTGNVALMVAALGVRVTGIDPSERLLELAAAEAARRGLKASFVEGEAASMPVVGRSVDVLVSCFGLIFAPDPAEAVAEIDRVVDPRGRILFTAWIPDGPIGNAMKIGRRNAPPGPPPFSWHDPDALEQLLGPHGFQPELERHALSFTGDSPEGYFERDIEQHPTWAGDAEARAEALALLTAENEDPGGFRVTSEYVVVTARRR
jgi:SAM-dependent methyltransferase